MDGRYSWKAEDPEEAPLPFLQADLAEGKQSERKENRVCTTLSWPTEASTSGTPPPPTDNPEMWRQDKLKLFFILAIRYLAFLNKFWSDRTFLLFKMFLPIKNQNSLAKLVSNIRKTLMKCPISHEISFLLNSVLQKSRGDGCVGSQCYITPLRTQEHLTAHPNFYIEHLGYNFH